MSGFDNSYGSSGNRDIRKLLGNPKITFVLGGPASGKGTQCAKLVEEFGYTHISVGDLMRAEKDKGTKDGERIRKIMNDGGLVPFELTVQILINGLIATPSKNYLIDGFPRAVDQAIYFEQNVCECQSVIFYDVSEEVLLDRCLVRAANSTVQREDDNEETLKKRLKAFKELSRPVVELYQKFGKVRYIDAGYSINEVFQETKKACLPQIFFLIGPKCSGKTALGQGLADRTNMQMLNFGKFLKDNGLKGKDDETVTMALIKHLINETQPRVLIEDFPQNETQARLFIKNCISPSEVFYLKCSKDTCQERMTELGRDHANYLPSSILSKKIKNFHDNSVKLLPYLRKETKFNEIDSEQTFNNAFKSISQVVEPTVVHIRSGGSSNELRKSMIETLTTQNGFVNLDVNSLIRDENERRTSIGQEFLNMVAAGKIIPAEMIVRMLRKIIYSGDGRRQFILSSFPDIIEQAREFEKSCASISAIIYTTTNDPVVEIKNNNLTLFNIDSLFQKEFRLKTCHQFNEILFTEDVQGINLDWSIVVGPPLSGKTTLCKLLESKFGYKAIYWNEIEERVKKTLGTEEEPFDGPVPSEKVFEAFKASCNEDKQKGLRLKYVLDDYYPKNTGTHDTFLCLFNQFYHPPQYTFICEVETKTLVQRYKKKLEVEEIENEAEIVDKINGETYLATALSQYYVDLYQGLKRVDQIILQMEGSEETINNELKAALKPKVILVNHEKRLTVDTTCANLAIKYNLLYISVYQIIKHHIENNTQFGKKLQATKKPRDIKLQTQAKDEFFEIDYSAVHFDLDLVIELIKHTIVQNRRSQKFILVEGFCNSGKLIFDDDKLEMRYMDELFMIEKNIGEVQAVIGLQFNSDKEYIEEYEIEYEVFPEPEVVEVKKRGEGEEGEEEQEQPPADDGEAKKPAFRVEDWKWTITDRKSKNLPQLFMQTKGIAARHELRTAEQYSSSQYEAISKCLDEFCSKVLEINDSAEKYLYQQVIFNE